VTTKVPRFDALHGLAANLRWTWHTDTADLLNELPGAAPGRHYLDLIAAMDEAELTAWAEERTSRLDALSADLDALTAGRPEARIAYCSPEFGIAAEVPQYSGGLGILAGDHLKSASDLGVPLIGVGLFYREGFFRQAITADKQSERYERIEPATVGAVDMGVTVTIPISGRDVAARVWKQTVGAVELILLDTQVDENSKDDQAITDRLYSGDRRHRLDQELVLGVGGVRALRALGIMPQVFHLNEGHACFLLLELLAEQIENGDDFATATATVRSRTLFTTHTPVPAGIDRFDRSLIKDELEPWARRLGVATEELLDFGVLPSDGPKKPFNTAALAFEFCGEFNGVSQLHATVSRELFATLPRARSLTGITNGVHARTWVTPPLQALYDDCLGDGWENGSASAWDHVAELDQSRFEALRDDGRRDLVELVQRTTGTELDPTKCVIGFARRFATYKRAALLLRDPDGLDAALAAGAQFVFAGKAHPQDNEGKAILAEIAKFSGSAEARGQVVIVPDYDIAVAQTMYGGCDVWLNNPIRPREASGTSGEKAALNGGLNCSILDGWWADFFVPGIGWSIPTSDAVDTNERDDAEAVAMNALIASAVLPAFGTDGWWQMIQAMLQHLGPKVTAGRMVSDYENRFYQPIRDA